MKSRIGITLPLSLVFMALIALVACADDHLGTARRGKVEFSAPRTFASDISGKYVDAFFHDGEGDPWVDAARTINIKRADADMYAVDICSRFQAQGAGGPATACFYGTGKIRGDYLLVSSTLTHKGKTFGRQGMWRLSNPTNSKKIPAIFKIYLHDHQDLADHAQREKSPAFRKLKTGQIAVIDEGGLPRQFPRDLQGYWAIGEELDEGDANNLVLPNGDPMFSGRFRQATFSGVYIKAPSFDCTKASNFMERAICDHAALSALDAYTAIEYEQALRISSDSAAVRTQQRQWLQQMYNQCADADFLCVHKQYNDRLSQLKKHNEQAAKRR